MTDIIVMIWSRKILKKKEWYYSGKWCAANVAYFQWNYHYTNRPYFHKILTIQSVTFENHLKTKGDTQYEKGVTFQNQVI